METTEKQTTQSVISLATWNIDQARREEQYAETRFDARWPRILTLLRDNPTDLLCVQEARNLETSAVTVNDVLYQVGQLGYDHAHCYYSADQVSFALCTFYRRDKFMLLDTKVLRLPNASGDGVPQRAALGLDLMHLATRREFALFNTHLSLDEDDKDAQTLVLADALPRQRMVCAGDFNFFDDRRGTAQRDLMLRQFGDLAYPLENASGTFMGFAHDEFKQPFEAMSRLDHVFAYGVQPLSARACGDMEEVRRRTYPSDHLMLRVTFALDEA